MKYKKGYKYQLQEDFRIKLEHIKINEKEINTEYIKLTRNIETNEVNILIRKGYAWDGATGAIDNKSILVGSLVHDALYQLIRQGYLFYSEKDNADRDFVRICKIYGMSKFRAWYVYNAVKYFGCKAAKEKKKVYSVSL